MNIATYYPREAGYLRLLLLITAACLGIGLSTPIITLSKFVVIESTFSVMGGTFELLRNGHFLLFILITGFSILLPVLKIGVLHRLLSPKTQGSTDLNRYLHWMHLYGRWSMLDVFVVAVLVVAVKLGAIASVEIRAGLYAFAAAVFLTMLITARVVVLADRVKAAA